MKFDWPSFVLWGGLLLLLGIVSGCDDPPPPPPPPVVQQRISKPPSPTGELAASEVSSPPSAPSESHSNIRSDTRPDIKPDAVPELSPVKSEDSAKAKPDSALIEKPEEEPAFYPSESGDRPPYNPEGRVDPFMALVDQTPGRVEGRSVYREKRAFLTPLENIDLSQMKLTAIISSPKGRQALVEETTGRGHIVNIGDFIGLQSGQVIAIESDRLIVEELVEDVMGKTHSQTSEVIMQRPPGD